MGSGTSNAGVHTIDVRPDVQSKMWLMDWDCMKITRRNDIENHKGKETIQIRFGDTIGTSEMSISPTDISIERGKVWSLSEWKTYWICYWSPDGDDLDYLNTIDHVICVDNSEVYFVCGHPNQIVVYRYSIPEGATRLVDVEVFKARFVFKARHKSFRIKLVMTFEMVEGCPQVITKTL
jgi:hypothetical protein